MGDTKSKRSRASAQARRRKVIGGIALAFVTAFVTAIASGLAGGAMDLVKKDPPLELISFSAAEEVAECGTPLFVPAKFSDDWIANGLKDPPPWDEFIDKFSAAPADSEWVNVSLQGESERAITITGIRFSAKHDPPPKGARFSNPCGGPGKGRTITVNMDHNPPRVIRTNDDPKGDGGPSDSQGNPATPMTFPWDVSVTDPLLLRIHAVGSNCECKWTAQIRWQSGKFTGTTTLDNHGKPFRFVNSKSRYYTSGGSTDAGTTEWQRLPQAEQQITPEQAAQGGFSD